MNYDTDAKLFASMMKITWQSCGRTNLDKQTMAYWFNKLINYDFPEVEKAFDTWLINQTELPTINDIIKLCRHKVTIFARLPSPLAQADNRRHAKEVIDFVSKNIKPQTDMQNWARKIIANPSYYPDISLKYAREALLYD